MIEPAFRVHVADQVLAALAESGTPMPTTAVEDRTGYDKRYPQLVYQTLTRLERSGDVERVSAARHKPVYWRRTAPVLSLPGGLL